MFFKSIYIFILAFTIIVDYIAGILIEKQNNYRIKKLFLIVSLVANIGVLAIFKYYNFFIDNLTVSTNFLGIKIHPTYLNILLPIGLSFHTFQAMSYTFEVYKGRQKAEKHFGIYALYVMFYPQLVAGPIERPQNMLHQFYEKKYFSFNNALNGLNLIALGLFKKMVVADRLAVYVNNVYGDIGNASTISMFMAVCFFSIQIYCDFSGYSDIARGTAKFMGFELMLNFNHPYSAQSISDFWARWHISLSTWFRDYVYIPLGGNRGKKSKWIRNLAIVFVLSGFWHGARWTFIIWGALHAFFLIFAIVTKKRKTNTKPEFARINRFINQTTVFGLVTLAWIFFRAESFQKAIQVLKKLMSFNFSISMTQICADKGPFNLILTFFCIFLWMIISIPKSKNIFKYLAFLVLITFLIIIFGNNDTSEFIYFQF